MKHMKPLATLLGPVLVIFAASVALEAAPGAFYVAPNGSDQWSGRSPKPDAAGKDGPFATIPAALQAARAAKQKPETVPNGVTVYLRAGTYELAEPIVLRPEDSGLNARQPLTIAAYQGERPVLSGGRRISNWQSIPGRPGLWQAEVADAQAGRWQFRQLFVNGERRQRARTPNQGFFRIQGESPQDKPVKLKFKPGDIKPEWAQDGEVEVVAFLAWGDLRMQIRAVDPTANVATLSGDPRPSNREANAQYYIENAPDALDQPGEWYLDRKSGVVTYWALPGEDLRSAEVIAPRIEDLLIMYANFEAQKAVQHVGLRGLTFSHTDYKLGNQGYADTQAAIMVRGNVRAEGAQDCWIEDCVFSHLAGYALELGRACQRVRVTGNEMFDLGAGGVRLGEAAVRPTPFELSHHLEVTDNHIHHGGLIYAPAVGVFILHSGQNRVAHNDIHHLYYTAVSVGWNWGYQETPCRENIIEFNHLHDLGQFLLSDMGAVYSLGIQKGTVIRNNLVHDVNAFTYGGWGLYTDEGSSDILLENNVVYRCKSAGFHQHYGRDNIVRNNIFALSRESQLMRSLEEAHRSFFFTNNIVYFDSGNLLGSAWSNDHYDMDGNVYWDTRLAGTEVPKLFAGATLTEWRQRGHDLHSVIADPLFVDPKNLDFRLKKESPALKLGFKPIDLSSVGVRPKNQHRQR